MDRARSGGRRRRPAGRTRARGSPPRRARRLSTHPAELRGAELSRLPDGRRAFTRGRGSREPNPARRIPLGLRRASPEREWPACRPSRCGADPRRGPRPAAIVDPRGLLLREPVPGARRGEGRGRPAVVLPGRVARPDGCHARRWPPGSRTPAGWGGTGRRRARRWTHALRNRARAGTDSRQIRARGGGVARRHHPHDRESRVQRRPDERLRRAHHGHPQRRTHVRRGTSPSWAAHIAGCRFPLAYHLMKTKRNSMPSRTYDAFESVAPYFDLARGALGDLVSGAHFFDVVDEDTVFEVLYDLGWPRIIRGRTALMAAFRRYA